MGGFSVMLLTLIRTVLFTGYEVTAFVRNPENLPESLAAQVTVKVGDVLDTAAVDEAVNGQDAVIILLGTRNDLSK